MAAFDNYWQDKIQHDAQHPIEFVKLRPDLNPNFNISILKQNIDNIDDMSDSELKNFIHRSFKSILKNVFQGNESKKYVNRFSNLRFLNAFTEVVTVIQFLDPEDIVICNTLCYHYITMDKDKQDTLVLNAMLKLGSIVNRASLPRLLGLGLSENLASLLLISRYSDINLNVCVKRVDFIIINQPAELMSERMIEAIFRILYDDVNYYMYRIFPHIMMDVLPEHDDADVSTDWVDDDDIQDVNSVFNLAILNIVNSLPRKTLRDTLMNYTECMNMIYMNTPVRFSLRTISNDYSRINDVINEMACIEGIYVP